MEDLFGMMISSCIETNSPQILLIYSTKVVYLFLISSESKVSDNNSYLGSKLVGTLSKKYSQNFWARKKRDNKFIKKNFVNSCS